MKFTQFFKAANQNSTISSIIARLIFFFLISNVTALPVPQNNLHPMTNDLQNSDSLTVSKRSPNPSELATENLPKENSPNSEPESGSNVPPVLALAGEASAQAEAANKAGKDRPQKLLIDHHQLKKIVVAAKARLSDSN